MKIPTLSGIRTRDPTNEEAADLRLRPHGHRDRTLILLCITILYSIKLYDI